MAERGECDISKTQIMLDLFAVDVEQHDEGWEKEFLDNVQAASFACSAPQVTLGPDGFPYFALSTPEPYQGFESFCVLNLQDDLLLEEGSVLR